MATYSAKDAVNVAKLYIKNIPVGEIDAEVCDFVSSVMYTAAFWRWTVSAFTPIPLADGTQDYTAPTMYRLYRVRIVRTDTTPDQYNDNIALYEWLPPDLTKSSPLHMTAACHETTLGKIRLQCATSVSSGETYELQGEKQADPTRITDSQLGVYLWFPDQYFPVFLEGVKWKLAEFADDQRASQWREQFYFLLDQMKRAEDAANGEASQFPSEPLGVNSLSGDSSVVFGGW